MSSGAIVHCDVDDVLQRFDAMERVTLDLTPTMLIVAEHLVSNVNDEFDTSGRGEWPGLAPSTLASRRGTSAQVLVDTGRFAASTAASAGPDWAEASSDVEYAKYHVSDRPRRRIPLRNPYNLPEEVIDECSVIVENDLTLRMQQAAGEVGAGAPS